MRSTLLYHIIPTRLPTNTTSNDEILATALEGQTLRINRYANNIYTVNCAPVIRRDQLATNGIIHLIDSVLLPSKVWPLQPVPETLVEDGRFRELSELMAETNFIEELIEIHGSTPYTLFAPFDEAFHEFHPEFLRRINSNTSIATGIDYNL